MDSLMRAPEVQWLVDDPYGQDVLWRATVRVSTHGVSIDEFDNVSTYLRMRPEIVFHIRAYPILRRTPKGAWINDDRYAQEKFVRREGNKRFACPTKEEAVESLTARYARRRRILTSQLTDTKIALKELEESTWLPSGTRTSALS